MLPAALALFCQLQADPVRTAEAARMLHEARAANFDQSHAKEILLYRQEFERRFNELATAIRDFSDSYNQSGGSVWPNKKAEALKKAIRAFERTEGWSKRQSFPQVARASP